jgi:hypothetical protein
MQASNLIMPVSQNAMGILNMYHALTHVFALPFLTRSASIWDLKSYNLRMRVRQNVTDISIIRSATASLVFLTAPMSMILFAFSHQMEPFLNLTTPAWPNVTDSTNISLAVIHVFVLKSGTLFALLTH